MRGSQAVDNIGRQSVWAQKYANMHGDICGDLYAVSIVLRSGSSDKANCRPRLPEGMFHNRRGLDRETPRLM